MVIQPQSIVNPSRVQEFIKCDATRACQMSDFFIKSFSLYGITSRLRIVHSLAQMHHECIGFSKYVENLNYSAEALARTWPTRFANTASKPNALALQIARNPKLIAHHAYQGRMGNDKPGDGWAFRGSGAIQITGKETTIQYAKFKGQDVYSIVELMRSTDEYAIDSACWFLTKFKPGVLKHMDNDDIVKSTLLINGGKIGLKERNDQLLRAKKIFS